MKGRFLISSNQIQRETNIYADKSALVLEWLLRAGIGKKEFSIRDVAKEIGVSIGLVQRVFGLLVAKGVLQTEGLRTAKTFFLKAPNLLLKGWMEQYSIIKKCKMHTYRSGLQGKKELLAALTQSGFRSKVVLALHSAAEAYKCKNTNLNTLELYILDPTVRHKLEDILELEPQERGYEVLLIEPYYKSLLNQKVNSDNYL